ncbi:hypothetical protein BJ875DRAFT_542429 [Amylocarpus encephaloides]|uniref:Uncharacterized protein n=1 Tax=Amylocarpus encephaloides TaxID=45428 RepID=A0A9P7YJP6_9HELO|nr:hypothetical protein BJ875DRAFT_542429 [Amylocarpus encephaloides]
MFTRTLLPALAAVGLANAQTATICSQPTITLASQADASALANCATISGAIVISPSASGTISVDGPQQVVGGFSALNAGNLVTLGSTTITSIGGDFTLTNLTTLSTLSFGSLKSCKNIAWSALPALPELTFAATVSKATSVVITNTFLSSLDGINLLTCETLDINNNNRLNTFSTQIANVTNQLTIDSNGVNLAVSFPNLMTVANATFKNASSITVPSLSTVSGSLGFYGTNMESVSAPNLTSIGGKTLGVDGGGLAFVGNAKLANISMPRLNQVSGAFQIANNSALTAISFPSLSKVGGAIDFSGNFSTPELPALTQVSGGFNVQSTAQIDCSTFDQEKGTVILGANDKAYTCLTTADAQAGVGSATTSGGSSSSTSKAAAASYGINEAVAGLSVVGGLLQMLL